MSIKQKITIAYVVTVSALLLLFSVFIDVAFGTYRQSLMRTRLERRANLAELFLSEPAGFRGTTALSLTEQYEAIYDAGDSLIYSSAPANDYVPTEGFLEMVRRRGEVVFTYRTPHWQSPKEGVALRFTRLHRNYVAIVTAYDLQGHHAGENLLFILVVGNVLLLFIVAIAAYVFARRAMQPFDRLIGQLNHSTAGDFRFRLRYQQRPFTRQPDEASYLSTAFNRLLENLQKLADSQKHFVGYASHELRTPLTVAKGQLDTAITYDQSLPDAKQSMQTALKKIDQAIGLANELLRLAELDGMNADLPRQEVNIIDLVMDTLDTMGRKYPRQTVDLTMTDAFVGQNEAVRLMGVPGLLLTTLVNITDNACKYSDNQPVHLSVDLVTTPPEPSPADGPDPADLPVEQSLEITITDRGIGIPPASLTDVSLPLMRADNVGSVDGFGLGLTLASKIVDLHRGQLRVESVLGEGTTVRLRLPVERV